LDGGDKKCLHNFVGEIWKESGHWEDGEGDRITYLEHAEVVVIKWHMNQVVLLG
jgi:hypothetical protein